MLSNFKQNEKFPKAIKSIMIIKKEKELHVKRKNEND